jgi:alpha/beta superfamily hydrolase
VVPLAEVQSWLQLLDRPPTTVVLPGVDHFFHGRLNALKKSILDNFVTE